MTTLCDIGPEHTWWMMDEQRRRELRHRLTWQRIRARAKEDELHGITQWWTSIFGSEPAMRDDAETRRALAELLHFDPGTWFEWNHADHIGEFHGVAPLPHADALVADTVAHLRTEMLYLWFPEAPGAGLFELPRANFFSRWRGIVNEDESWWVLLGADFERAVVIDQTWHWDPPYQGRNVMGVWLLDRG